MTKHRLIDFNINEDLNKKFLNEIKKLDPRTKNIFLENDFINFEKFRSHFLSNAGNNPYWFIRGVGTKTEKTLIDLFRKTLIKNLEYTIELKNYNQEFNKLSGHAQKALARKGIGIFETFYFVYFIKKQPVSFDDYPFEFVRKEVKYFIKVRCKSVRSIKRKPKSTMQS